MATLFSIGGYRPIPNTSKGTAISQSDRLEDGALIERLRVGDLTAVNPLYARHAGSLLRVAYRLTSSIADAEDVVQDVFVGLPRAARKYSEQGSLGAWLSRVTVRIALDRMRRRRRQREVPLDLIAEPANGADPDRVFSQLTLSSAIAELSDKLRIVFVLKEIEGYSHAEIGRLLGIRRGTSEVRLLRAVRNLRALLRSSQ